MPKRVWIGIGTQHFSEEQSVKISGTNYIFLNPGGVNNIQSNLSPDGPPILFKNLDRRDVFVTVNGSQGEGQSGCSSHFSFFVIGHFYPNRRSFGKRETRLLQRLYRKSRIILERRRIFKPGEQHRQDRTVDNLSLTIQCLAENPLAVG